VDKIKRIKRLVESSFEISYGDNLIIKEMVIVPTQKYDQDEDRWLPDSHAIFLSIENKTDSIYTKSNITINEVTNFVESLLNLECCVDFV
jgi:hypothetical protein